MYVPDSLNLISHTQAEDQGIIVEYCSRKGEKIYELRQNNETILESKRDDCGLFTFEALNNFQPVMIGNSETLCKKEFSRPQVNHTRANRHAVQRWHERLGHLNPQRVTIMAN